MLEKLLQCLAYRAIVADHKLLRKERDNVNFLLSLFLMYVPLCLGFSFVLRHLPQDCLVRTRSISIPRRSLLSNVAACRHLLRTRSLSHSPNPIPSHWQVELFVNPTAVGGLEVKSELGPGTGEAAGVILASLV